jgi:tRNA threonylcarbamoyladenosine biosynthesis protein TsaE
MDNSQQTAASLLAKWSEKREEADSAFVVGLSGHLGAGKTAFVKLVATELGIDEIVTSPTFVIMKIYEGGKKGVAFKRLVHIDAYRLERREELDGLGFEHVVADKNSLVMIEWPENVRLEDADLDTRLNFQISANKYLLTGGELVS